MKNRITKAIILSISIIILLAGVALGAVSTFKVTDNSDTTDNSPSTATYNGATYIAFCSSDSQTSEEVYVRTNASGKWTTQRLTQDSFSDTEPSIAVYKGFIYVVYTSQRGESSDIYLRTNASGKWTTNNITQSSSWEYSPSIAVYNGAIYISYVSDNNHTSEILLRSNASGSWTTNNISNDSNFNSEPSIAVFNGSVYVAYVADDNVFAEIYLRTNASGKWTTTRLSNDEFIDFSPNIAINSAGKIYVAWANENTRVKLKTNSPSKWTQIIRPNLTTGNTWINKPSINLVGNKICLTYSKHTITTQNNIPTENVKVFLESNTSGAWIKKRVANYNLTDQDSQDQNLGVSSLAVGNKVNVAYDFFDGNDWEIYLKSY